MAELIAISKDVKDKVLLSEEYKKAIVPEEKKTDVETLVENVILDFAGSTDDEKRANLPKLPGNVSVIHAVVDELMSNLPSGVERVDGYTVRPLIKKIVLEQISKLPKPKEIEEIV